MKQFLKRFLQLFSILFSLGIHTAYLSASAAVMPMPSIDSGMNVDPANSMSVHDMFKDVPQDELLAMMEEGQQFIRYLEEHGTEEEKMAFAQAMEETLQGFSEADWLEFEAIVETVQDKLPPLFESKEAVQVEPVKEVVQPIKETKSKPVIDNSLEKILHAIHKAINAILLKAKSDKLLTERITIEWENKDDFNEMVRLLQLLNKKELIEKLITAHDYKIDDTKDDAKTNEAKANKLLLESIQNFNKRLQVENDQFIIADTFGLQIDEATTAENLKKLNIILDFFDNAIASLLPKLVKFIQSYEPEALKLAQEHDEQAKKALEHATKIEKQKRPAGQMMSHDRSPSNGSQKRPNYTDSSYHNSNTGTGHSKEHPRGYLENVHMENIKNVPQLKKENSKNNAGHDKSQEEKKEAAKKSAYDNAIDMLESYPIMFSNQEMSHYAATIDNAKNIYLPFGKPIDETTKTRAEQLQTNRSTLNSDDELFLQKYDQQIKTAHDNFRKNTQKAFSHYAQLQESIEKILPQIDEMLNVLRTLRTSIDQMNAQELEQLSNSLTLKNFSARINSYHKQFKNVQHELKNKHKLHKLEHEDAFALRDYDDLALKVNSLHGLDKKIAEAQSQFDTLNKAIKAAIVRRKRDQNKAASKQ